MDRRVSLKHIQHGPKNKIKFIVFQLTNGHTKDFCLLNDKELSEAMKLASSPDKNGIQGWKICMSSTKKNEYIEKYGSPAPDSDDMSYDISEGDESGVDSPSENDANVNLTSDDDASSNNSFDDNNDNEGDAKKKLFSESDLDSEEEFGKNTWTSTSFKLDIVYILTIYPLLLRLDDLPDLVPRSKISKTSLKKSCDSEKSSAIETKKNVMEMCTPDLQAAEVVRSNDKNNADVKKDGNVVPGVDLSGMAGKKNLFLLSFTEQFNKSYK